MTAKQKRARAYVKANYTFIMLHALYQRWGLPTKLLKRTPARARPQGQE